MLTDEKREELRRNAGNSKRREVGMAIDPDDVLALLDEALTPHEAGAIQAVSEVEGLRREVASLKKDRDTLCHALGIYNSFIAEAPKAAQESFAGVAVITRDAWAVYTRVRNGDPSEPVFTTSQVREAVKAEQDEHRALVDAEMDKPGEDALRQAIHHDGAICGAGAILVRLGLAPDSTPR